MVIVDGVEMDPAFVSPVAHQFIGYFRPVAPPDAGSASALRCTCKHTLWTREEMRQHWADGHFDVPQYRTIQWQTGGAA